MLREARITVEILLGAVLIAAAAFWGGSCGADPVDAPRADAYDAERILRQTRNTLVQAQSKTDTVTRTVIQADRRVLAERDSLISVLIYTDSVFANAAATNAELRLAYAVQRARLAQYVTANDSLQAYARDLIAAHALERLATNATLTAADSTIAAVKRVADAERRKGWRRFTQGAFAGAILVLLAAVTL